MRSNGTVVEPRLAVAGVRPLRAQAAMLTLNSRISLAFGLLPLLSVLGALLQVMGFSFLLTLGSLAVVLVIAVGRAFAQSRTPRTEHEFTLADGLLDEDSFRRALVREQTLAARHGWPFLLILIRLDGRVDSEPGANAVCAALPETISPTSVIGWFERGSTIGVLLAEIDEPGSAGARATVSAIEGVVDRNLGAARIGELLVYDDAGSLALMELDNRASNEDAFLDFLVRATGGDESFSNAAKRALDICGSVVLLVLFAPFLLAVAMAVKLTSRGPILFRQERLGEHGRRFRLLKFRTMHVSAEGSHRQFLSEFIQAGPIAAVNAVHVFKIVDDPRVTKVGRFLRRSGVDEFPALLNVLVGDMSLVGPRPLLPYEVEMYRRWHRNRLTAKPGITGPSQITAARISFEDMVRTDVRYIRNRSLWTDLRILLATPWAVLTGRGAI